MFLNTIITRTQLKNKNKTLLIIKIKKKKKKKNIKTSYLIYSVIRTRSHVNFSEKKIMKNIFVLSNTQNKKIYILYDEL